MIVHLHKENGHVTDQRTLDQVCGFLPNGDYVATFEKRTEWERKQPRSLNQNALFWVWCADIATFFNREYGDSGWDKDNVHDYFCEMFRRPEILPNGKVVDKWVETSKLNKRQMQEFMSRIQEYMAAEHGVAVPLPEDDAFRDFHAIYG